VSIRANSWIIRLPPEGQAYGRGLLGFVPFAGCPVPYGRGLFFGGRGLFFGVAGGCVGDVIGYVIMVDV